MKIFHVLCVLSLGISPQCLENTSPDKCDPPRGNFIRGTHFISEEFLTEENNWNYSYWNQYRKNQSEFRPESGCIPITQPESSIEQIEQREKVTDLIR